MKSYLKLILSVIIFLMFIGILNLKVSAQALDQIEDYKITIEPQKDATLNMTYHIEWIVLDSSTEGPLSWVEIGIPNSNVKLKKISSNIKKISIPKKVGNYARIDFKKKYYAGDTVSFDFTIEKVQMYKLQGYSNLLSYNFIPGWFDDIEVKNITVLWKANNVKEHNGRIKDEYITWSGHLKPGSKLEIQVSYYKSYFNIKTNWLTTNWWENPFVMFFIFLLIIVVGICSAFSTPNYYGHRGYGYYGGYGYGGMHHHHYHGGFGGGGFGGRRRWRSAVAGGGCACACAGGGRAGCSRKDFYGVSVSQFSKM